MVKNSDPCVCQSGESYESCCGRYLEDGALAPDPEALMRSRYAAFVMNRIDYLAETWHPETCPEKLDEEAYTDWVGLEVLEVAVDEDDVEGEVEFVAKLVHDNKLEVLHELSHFDKVDGKWLYHSGEFKNEGEKPAKIPKSAPCPCGSGKAFKNCHFKS